MIPTFQDHVKAHSAFATKLPLTHTARGTGFQKIINSGKLRTRYCDVMKADRLFFFLGVPAYKYGNPSSSDKRRSSAPICFVIDRDAVGTAFETFPFDTGCLSFAQESYELDDKIDFEDYKITSDPDAPERIVSAIFEDNTSYVKGNVPEKCRKAVHALDFQTQQLLEIITSPEKNSIDERISTIEIQIDRELNLTPSNVLAIAAPDIICESKEFKDLAASFSADAIPYPWRRASNYQRSTQIEDAVLKYLESKGLA